VHGGTAAFGPASALAAQAEIAMLRLSLNVSCCSQALPRAGCQDDVSYDAVASPLVKGISTPLAVTQVMPSHSQIWLFNSTIGVVPIVPH
jgi:hypothetical protein